MLKSLAKTLHSQFIFKTQGSREELDTKLAKLKNKINGLKRAIEYIQDFLNVHGEKIWNEELTKIILFAVEKEAKSLINKKYTAQLAEQEQEIPRFRPVDVND